MERGTGWARAGPASDDASLSAVSPGDWRPRHAGRGADVIEFRKNESARGLAVGCQTHGHSCASRARAGRQGGLGRRVSGGRPPDPGPVMERGRVVEHPDQSQHEVEAAATSGLTPSVHRPHAQLRRAADSRPGARCAWGIGVVRGNGANSVLETPLHRERCESHWRPTTDRRASPALPSIGLVRATLAGARSACAVRAARQRGPAPPERLRVQTTDWP